MSLFGKGKNNPVENPSVPLPPSGLPTDLIITMKQQGYNDDQINDNLKGHGYNPSQIFDAMNKVNMSQQVPPQPDPMQAPEQNPYPPPEPNPYSPMDQSPPEQPIDLGPYPSIDQPQENIPAPVTEKERIEELAEAIIDEKWNELVKDIDKVIEWKSKTESRIVKIEQILVDMNSTMETLHRGLIGKISDYDRNLENVGVEIKAMEKVFQKILPSLTDNINRLERIGNKRSSSKKG